MIRTNTERSVGIEPTTSGMIPGVQPQNYERYQTDKSVKEQGSPCQRSPPRQNQYKTPAGLTDRRECRGLSPRWVGNPSALAD